MVYVPLFLLRVPLPFRLLSPITASFTPAESRSGAVFTANSSDSQASRSSTAPPAEDQRQFISYWTTETGWRTELQLRNNQVGQTLTVTPVLRSVDGTETPLPPVLLQPQEVKTLDVASAIGTSAPQLIGAYGSLVLRYRVPSAGNLYAVAMIMSVGHSIAFHIDGTGEDQTEDVGSREGIWWLPNSSISDYLVLTNQGMNPLQTNLSVSDSGGKTYTRTVTLEPRSVVRYSIRQIVSAAKLGGAYGGISVSAVSHAGSLDTLHVLFDPSGGFSAVMKMFDYDSRVQLKERDYAKTGKWTLRAPMLALSNPDPALAFPEGTVLQPQLFIRNVTSKPVEAALAFNWRTASATGKAAGPALHLGPYETRRIDVAALQDGKTMPQTAQWSSVVLTTNSLPGEVAAVAQSYDQTLKYGAQTPFSDQLAFHYAGSQWEYDPYHDSIITVGNGGTKPTRAAFTIFYNRGTQKYDLEQTLQPDEQMWMDIGKLIRQNTPDKNGKALPPDLTSGSYEIRDLENHIGTLFEGKIIYDKTYGHVTYGCEMCCGYKRIAMSIYALDIPLGSSAGNGVTGLDSCSGQYQDISGDFEGDWSTVNSSVATVDYFGTFTGQGVGSTTSSTFADEPWFISNYSCPVEQRFADGTDSVVGPPDHLTVVVDQGGYPQSCPSTGIYLRQMLMQVVDVSGNALVTNPSIVESYNPSQPSNSCGNGSPVPSACAPTGPSQCTSCSTAQFLDSMAVSGSSGDLCNTGISQSSGCGFSLTSTWTACGTSGNATLWVSTRATKSNGVTVDGNSTGWKKGTVCNSTGCH